MVALDSVERAVAAVLMKESSSWQLGRLPPLERESVAIARRLRTRLDSFSRSGDCRRCWLQKAHCICEDVKPIADKPVGRIFVVMSHKEICLAVDTAKLICAAFDDASLLVGGLGCQPAWREMETALLENDAAILFPSEDSVEASELCWETPTKRDLVVVDGTWSQARKLHKRLPEAARRVRLSDSAVDILATGRGKQLRRHPEPWRQVSTATALDALFSTIQGKESTLLEEYQRVANSAAIRQLGPPFRQ